MTDADDADDLALLANTPAQAESLLHNSEQGKQKRRKGTVGNKLTTLTNPLFCLLTAQMFIMCKCEANISCRRYTPSTLKFFFLSFFSFLFLYLFLSAPLSFYLFPPTPTATKSLIFWWSLYVNKDEILMEFVVYISVYPLFRLFFIFWRNNPICYFSIYIYIYI